MQSSDIPAKFNIPFANAGTKNAIPESSQIGITDGAASLNDGFPSLTFTDINSGGVAPDGADFNGIFYEITLAQRWLMAGGLWVYDSAFQTAIGGYPKGALVINATLDGIWISTAENNLTDPDTGGAGWAVLSKASYYALLGGDATQAFLAANGTAGNEVVTFQQFASSIGTSGHQQYPGGLIYQWSTTASIAASGSASVTFPIAFPTACFFGDVASNTGSTGNANTRAYGWSSTGMTVYNGESSASVLYFWAWGH